VPVPSNSATTNQYGSLQAVSCPSAAECIGVGSYTILSGDNPEMGGLIETGMIPG
jgi:hypothetical protein